MKKSDVRKYAPGTAEYIVMHARYQQSRGRRPSVGFPWQPNPRLALEFAKYLACFPKSGVYLNGQIPTGYACCKCGADDCKLWRGYRNQTLVTLLCAVCAAKSQRASIRDIDTDGRRTDKLGRRTDHIGKLAPAVPTEETGYWVIVSIPQAGYDWWKKLPTLPLTAR